MYRSSENPGITRKGTENVRRVIACPPHIVYTSGNPMSHSCLWHGDSNPQSPASPLPAQRTSLQNCLRVQHWCGIPISVYLITSYHILATQAAVVPQAAKEHGTSLGEGDSPITLGSVASLLGTEWPWHSVVFLGAHYAEQSLFVSAKPNITVLSLQRVGPSPTASSRSVRVASGKTQGESIWNQSEHTGSRSQDQQPMLDSAAVASIVFFVVLAKRVARDKGTDKCVYPQPTRVLHFADNLQHYSSDPNSDPFPRHSCLKGSGLRHPL